MKLKKINRGFILLLALIVGIALYVWIDSLNQKEVRTTLVALYEQYLEAEEPFLILSQESDEKWESACRAALSPHLAQSTDAEKKVLDTLSKNRTTLKTAGDNGLSAFKKELTDRPATLIMEGNFARLAVFINISNTVGEFTSQSVVSKQVLFCKENGVWKITVPDGTTPTNMYDSDYNYSDSVYDEEIKYEEDLSFSTVGGVN